jgi:HlyD family secretion protein
MKRIVFLALVFLFLAAYFFYKNQEEVKKHDPIITLYGNVDIRQVDLGFRVKGRLLSMEFEEGEIVEAGTLLAQLDQQPYQDQVVQASAHLESIQTSLANTQELISRRQQLIDIGAVAQEEYDDALFSYKKYQANSKEAGATLGIALTNLQDTQLFSPSEGTIIIRICEPGTIVREADPVYTLALLTPVWIRAYVSEIQLGEIYPGMAAEIYTDTPGASVYTGQIGFISPVAEFTPKTVETTQLRTDLVYRLRIIANNPDHGLRQGMPVTVKLLSSKSAQPSLK